MDNALIYFGGAVKALDDNGRVGGYLVRFSDPDADEIRKDLTGEYFTTKTYLGPADGDGAESIFDHGFAIEPPAGSKVDAATLKAIRELADRTFQPLKTKRDAVGIWAETVLDIADAYEQAVFGMVKKGKLGWSSGAPGHRVKKAEDGQILRWPIGEGSLTPRPAEPLNRAIAAKSLTSVKFVSLDEDSEGEPGFGCEDCNDNYLKGAQDYQCAKHRHAPSRRVPLAAKLNQLIEDRVDDGLSRDDFVKRMAREATVDASVIESVLSGDTPRPPDAHLKAFARVLGVDFGALRESAHGLSQTIKGMFEEALAEQTPSRWELDSVYSRIIRKLANAASASQLAGVSFDLAAKVKEATAEYLALLEAHALSQIEAWLEDGSEEEFYLKAIVDLSSDLPVSGQLDLDDHSQVVVSALREVAKRFRANHEGRVKSGRVLSEKNRTRLSTLLEQLQPISEELQKLLDESKPMASDAEKRAVLGEYLRMKQRLHQIGVN